MISPRPHIEKLFRTPPDVGSRKDFLRLDKNDRIITFPDKIWRHFTELFDEISVMSYPEQERFYEMLASYIGVPREHLILSLGSDLAIKMVYETYIEPNEEIQLHMPSYAMYEVYGNMFQANISSIAFNDNLKLDIDLFINKISNNTRMVVVENPNGFIGTSLGYDNIRKIAEKAHSTNTILLIDEAYYQFMGNSAQELYLNYDNVIIVRSFSKDFGMAGLRCGYLLSQKKNIDYIYRVKPMNEANSAAIAFGLTILEYPEYIDNYIDQVNESIVFMKESLSKMGYRCGEGYGNFIVVFVGEKIDQIIALLKNKGVLVRRPFQVEHLKGWLRIGIGNINDMEHFVNRFKEVIGELD